MRPALAIEIADSSLLFDREHKGSLYAGAGVQDSWIVNLIDRMLEVYRNPVWDSSAAYGWRYRSVKTLEPPASVAPLALPSVLIPVGRLLP